MAKTKNKISGKRSKKLNSLFHIEKSLQYKKTFHQSFKEILKFKSSSSCNKKTRL